MAFTLDTVLEHLREQPDLLAAVLQGELDRPIELDAAELTASSNVPDVHGFPVGAWVVAGSQTYGLLLSADLVPVEWDGIANADEGLADRLAAGLFPELVEYREPRLATAVEFAAAVTDQTVAVRLPVTDGELLLLSGLHNPSAVERVGDGRLRDLPVDVVVTLAEKRIDVGQLLAITPGALIAFSKPCEDLLDLYVNNHLHARGEAVKMGEKFGLKVSQIGVRDARVSPVLPPVR